MPPTPSNKPGTCLWCGKKLRRKYRTTWRQTEKRPSACGGRINDGTWEVKTCGGKVFKKMPNGNWQCQTCHRWETLGRKAVETREPVYEGLGDYGDDAFCNKKHGYWFAVWAARNGFRLPAQLGRKVEKNTSPTCRCAGPNFDPDTPCPVPGHRKIHRTPLKLVEEP